VVFPCNVAVGLLVFPVGEKTMKRPTAALCAPVVFACLSFLTKKELPSRGRLSSTEVG